ncbi:hypothetical protein M436DRAFT_85757 [Aureobasidium namibiae CBS 147.97]|uniref:Uncharacterized protein n=1 Tax=Aureobasidium namibiae CBS 147.97 TaxID=1043004 RepID=A0A074X3D7_9PEZI
MTSDSMNISNPAGAGSSASETTQAEATRSHAFSLSLTAYDDQTGDRSDKRVFAVESVKKMATSDARLAAIKNADPETLPSRIPLNEELELNTNDKDTTTVVWVGMLPSSTDLEEKTKMASSRGYSVNSINDIKPIEMDPKAMRATKLCTGIMTSVDSVFFFPEFRDDDATSVQKRKDTWGAKVREACDKSEDAKSGIKHEFDEIEVEDRLSISAEIIDLAQSYEKTDDISYMKEIARAAKQHVLLMTEDDEGYVKKSERRKVVKRESDSE